MVIFFRTYRLAEVPTEPYSDHAEKLLDVYDVLQGKTSIFFTRNTGREALQFYLTAVVALVFGTGVSFMSLKIGTVLVGLATLPFHLHAWQGTGRQACRADCVGIRRGFLLGKCRQPHRAALYVLPSLCGSYVVLSAARIEALEPKRYYPGGAAAGNWLARLHCLSRSCHLWFCWLLFYIGFMLNPAG